MVFLFFFLLHLAYFCTRNEQRPLRSRGNTFVRCRKRSIENCNDGIDMENISAFLARICREIVREYSKRILNHLSQR